MEESVIAECKSGDLRASAKTYDQMERQFLVQRALAEEEAAKYANEIQWWFEFPPSDAMKAQAREIMAKYPDSGMKIRLFGANGVEYGT